VKSNRSYFQSQGLAAAVHRPDTSVSSCRSRARAGSMVRAGGTGVLSLRPCFLVDGRATVATSPATGYWAAPPGPRAIRHSFLQAQVKELHAAGAEEVWRETASGWKTDRVQLRRVVAHLEAGDLLVVTRLDRLALSTRDLLNVLAAITRKRAGFLSLGDAWADTTTPHGRLMLTVLRPGFETPG
jgi:Resolvase, N terminal domain